jgi:hypothetical protein
MHNAEVLICVPRMLFQRRRPPLGPEFGKDGGGARDAAGMASEAGAQLFRGNAAATAIVGAGATAGFAGETQGLELAMDRAGAKAHGGLPLKVSLPLSASYIAVQHRFDKERHCDTAMQFLHGSFHKLFTLPII